MNGFADHGLDEGAFAPKAGTFTENLSTFDAFPKTKATYTRRTTTGGYTTLLLAALATLLFLAELRSWTTGTERQQFSVEKGVAHTLQINLDAVVAMRCGDLHVNVQDASGDRIFAGEMLARAPTDWALWVDRDRGLLGNQLGAGGGGGGGAGGGMEDRRGVLEEEDTHVGHVLGEVRRGGRKFRPSPRLAKGVVGDSCRVYGSLEGNKVQGDFHITARGHGYQEFGEHLDHDAFNFSHLITELSFGPLYPTLLNPLDHTLSTTPSHFHRFQYYLSIVPTIYTRKPSQIPQRGPLKPTRHTIRTNQYAVTSASQDVPHQAVPGIFFKFDIEPILLTVVAQRGSWLAFVVRAVNVVSGVLVGGGWVYRVWEWAWEVGRQGGRRRSGVGRGVLHGGGGGQDEGEEDDE